MGYEMRIAQIEVGIAGNKVDMDQLYLPDREG